MNSKTKGLINFLLPAAIILIALLVNKWLGIAALLVYIVILMYMLRPSVLALIGTRKYAQGSTEEAMLLFGRAYATGRASVRTSVSYAYLLLKNKDLQKSEEILQKLINANQNSPMLPYIKSIMALVLWKKGNLNEAASMQEEVIQTYKTTSVYGSLGYLLILQGDLEKALKFNLEAYEYNSSDNIINDNLGQNYLLLGMYDKAAEIYKPLLEKAPTFPEPYYNYGLVLDKLGDREKALETMKKALDCKFSYLSTITKDDVEAKLSELSD
ncbi:MAG: tetratricopeptide repeat protein [Clostridiaceae bacterium]|jgi:tetratricopeptide (TPR) repeat protein|nr:tetratricopeptide repeat protein [Clostridiaceae bacterium]